MTHETYAPRPISNLGTFSFPGLDLKIYGLCATGQSITDAMQQTARHFIREDVLPRMTSLGDSNGLGFAIIHPGTTGLSISVHWWAQGSVLCQRFFRQLYGTDTPLDMTERPSIGCVWEMGIIAEETKIWRDTMMAEVPNLQGYLQMTGNLSAI